MKRREQSVESEGETSGRPGRLVWARELRGVCGLHQGFGEEGLSYQDA
jgi:hypothetical protein